MQKGILLDTAFHRQRPSFCQIRLNPIMELFLRHKGLHRHRCVIIRQAHGQDNFAAFNLSGLIGGKIPSQYNALRFLCAQRHILGSSRYGFSKQHPIGIPIFRLLRSLLLPRERLVRFAGIRVSRLLFPALRHLSQQLRLPFDPVFFHGSLLFFRQLPALKLNRQRQAQFLLDGAPNIGAHFFAF